MRHVNFITCQREANLLRSTSGLARKRNSAYSRTWIGVKPVFTVVDPHGKLMLLHQIRQLLAGQQQLERSALAWCPLYESQLLQAQDHLMD
jgi:hypothetical protein